VSPLDGINGARPPFIGPGKRSTVAAAEQMASTPKQRSSIIQPECPVGEVPIRLKDLSPPTLPEPAGNSTQINGWLGRGDIQVVLGRTTSLST
jgi:hypothetical protein